MSDQRARKDLRKIISIYYVFTHSPSQLVGCTTQAASAVFVLPLILPPPPPHTHTNVMSETSLP